MTAIEEKVLSKVRTDPTVKMLQRLIQTKTANPPGEELVLAEWVAGYLEKAGLQVDLMPFAGKRGNLVARIKGTGEGPGLIFSAHFDTVPEGEISWTYPPYGAEIHDDRIYGRGAADMKGGMAAMIIAVEALANTPEVKLKGDLIIAFTSGETSDLEGAKLLVESRKLETAGAFLVSEPTGLEVLIAEKGALWMSAQALGKTSHSSMPEKGENAISKMVDFLYDAARYTAKSTRHKLLGDPTITVGTIQGGVIINVVPDRCHAQIDVRFPPPLSPIELFEDYKRLAGDRVKLEIIDYKLPVDTDPDHAFIKICLEACGEITGEKKEAGGTPYFTDGTIICNEYDLPMAIIGPAPLWMTHQHDEHVEIPKLVQAAKIFALIALRYL
ncbi:MAG: ArgE/DapE family deacylase [candidate division Zixibacteria bacterium]|nr:ArgE/DapE family deacylase [candidate division Zixibacteria bacterium]